MALYMRKPNGHYWVAQRVQVYHKMRLNTQATLVMALLQILLVFDVIIKSAFLQTSLVDVVLKSAL